MSDTTSPPSYTYTITILSLPSGASAPTSNTWEVAGSYLQAVGETYTISDAEGNVLALAPVGSVITRNDAVVKS